MKKLVCWILSLSLSLSVLSLPVMSYPSLARAAERVVELPAKSVDLVELIKLQKQQIDDYSQKDQTREEQIAQLNQSLSDCRTDIEKEIDATAKKERWKAAGSISGYIVGLIGIVSAAAIYAVKR